MCIAMIRGAIVGCLVAWAVISSLVLVVVSERVSNLEKSLAAQGPVIAAAYHYLPVVLSPCFRCHYH